jgi:hypothetical protein
MPLRAQRRLRRAYGRGGNAKPLLPLGADRRGADVSAIVVVAGAALKDGER